MPDERLDMRLARELGVTRSRGEKLIREGCVRVNGRMETKPGTKVQDGAVVLADVPPPAVMEALPEALPLTVLYEDEHLAVVIKPCGMVVHPAPGNETGTMVNALLHHLSGLSGIGGTLRPGIVHRLDKDTSGLLLVAKDDSAHLALSAALKAREIQKTYKAVAQGAIKNENGVIEASITRHPVDRKKMAVAPDGRYAKTVYRVQMPLRGATLLEVDLITGRTHQIRVHFAHIGHPLLGDAVYGRGDAQKSASRLMLHAWRLCFLHPVTGRPMCFEAPEPLEFLSEVQKRLP